MVAWRMPRHSSSGSSAASPGPAVRARPSQVGRLGRLDPGGPNRIHTTLCYRPDQMQKASRGANGIAANGARRRRTIEGGPPHPRRHPAPPLRWRSSAGFVGVVFAVGAYAQYATDLPDPGDPHELGFEQPSIVYDRTGKVELARFGSLRRELIGFDDIPREMLDATTAIEDKEFWTNPGFDPVGILRPASTPFPGATRRLHDHPAARPRPPAPRLGVRGRDLRAEAPRDHPVRRLTRRTRARKARRRSCTAYLNKNFYGNKATACRPRPRLLRQAMGELTPRPVRDPRRDPAVADKFDLARNATQASHLRGGRRVPRELDLVVPADTEVVIRRNHVLELMKDRTAQRPPATTTPPPEYEQAKRSRSSSRRSCRRHLAAAALRLAGPPRARCASSARLARRLRAGRHRRLQGHHDARLEDAGRPRSGSNRRPRPERTRTSPPPDVPRNARRSRPTTTRGSSPCAANGSTTRPRR